MSKITINQLHMALCEANSIMLTVHVRPDGDAIGSCLGLCLYLRQLQLNATVVSPNDFPEFLKWLPAVDDIIIYDNDQERAKTQIEASTLIFTLDFNSLKRADSLSGLLEKQTATFAMIDHHQAPEDYAQVTFSDPSASSTCEMVYRFIEAMGDRALINSDIATCLYTGLMTDTGNFKYPTTTSDTLRIGAFLIDQGANNSQINSLVFDTNSYNKLQLLSVALRNLVYVEEWNTAYITLTSEELQQHNHQKGDTEGFVNYGLRIKEAELAAIFIENEEDKLIKISFRSKTNLDVNLLARTYFNGGGHINAAGGSLHISLEDTLKYFLEVLPKFLSLPNAYQPMPTI